MKVKTKEGYYSKAHIAQILAVSETTVGVMAHATKAKRIGKRNTLYRLADLLDDAFKDRIKRSLQVFVNLEKASEKGLSIGFDFKELWPKSACDVD